MMELWDKFKKWLDIKINGEFDSFGERSTWSSLGLIETIDGNLYDPCDPFDCEL